MNMLLSKKVVLVTGAQQGIGRAIAVACADAGADVAINYLDDAPAAESVAQEVRARGRRAYVIQADVAVVAEVAAMVDSVVEEFGQLDILINNAGVFPRVTFVEMRDTDWDYVLDINLKGACFCARAAAKAMIAANRSGSIISMASLAVGGLSPRGVHYAASKGGIVSMTRAMALELAPHGIRVNAIAPGLTDTAQPRYGNSEAELAERAARIPLGRIGRPEEIATVAVFLASGWASFVTGETVHVNGGAYMS
jgi:NAD(P)-dependent dehydrogenase (short-subunit alcohol dehydrogenase family)